MIFYLIGITILIIILCAALYIIYSNMHKNRINKSKEYNVLFDKDTIVDELITQLTEKNKTQETENEVLKSKEDILTTFIELHRSGSFCGQLSEQEIIYFVKKKLDMESNKNG
ncbi:methanolan biosynthesis protein EpsI [Pseudoalteromonas sp. SR44-5]|uniref:Methanolan biosynthesis protein EpsI n=1 Tax=Pseudoalteromonas neustonica TaxID=1840331 RepID=A0ABY3FK26_9GAMM|nr:MULTISPECIES: methanolan biosynthesis protein EpsI [Pseudoalteromonas]MBB1334808.1 methanolan biosynthesis protein EpsI [Pseudoalteromonas sp. SR41-6]MBB1367804.1 methanolan biosynthesis protein EpsI [Pseudoalteromonas sp. SR44-5]MBB1424274.1 methanolan biosynthesis protein EpsI [Pseudoalteromonas sp. SG43-7]MBB1460401.1 methanolan biosynthesis protein EpsI [Pseudoalteromonas sp. SG41-8]MBB1481270.1 methanolan biosynthesis protein EpsI [Pseudoalteromonas sp. SG41-2]